MPVDLQSMLRRPLPCVHLGKVIRPCPQYREVGSAYHCKKLRVECGRSRLARKVSVCCENCQEYEIPVEK